MSQTLRIESKKRNSLITVRANRSQLVYANNKELENQTITKLARYQERHSVIIYAFVLEGSHQHGAYNFPKANRAQFMRDFNSTSAKAIKHLVPNFTSGRVFERRYAEQQLALSKDVEEKFFYCALQVVQDGVATSLYDSNAYNSFDDAINGRERLLKDVNWTKYNNAKRFNQKVNIERYTTIRKLVYTRLPGYEDLSQKEYRDLMLLKLDGRQQEIIKERLSLGKAYMTKEARDAVKCTSFALSPKRSTRESFYPIVLSLSPEAREECLKLHFQIARAHRKASKRYLRGEKNVKFPPGTYKPPMLMQPED